MPKKCGCAWMGMPLQVKVFGAYTTNACECLFDGNDFL